MCPVMAFASRTYPTLQQAVRFAGSDVLHSPPGLAYPNSANGAFVWNSAARLTRVTYSTNSTAFLDRVYTLSAAGDRVREDVNAGLLPTLSPAVQRLTQDPADRLTALYQKTLPDSPAWATNTPTWEANGNMLADGSGLTLSFDAGNRVTNLQSAVVGTRSVFYNACGAAVKRVVNGTNIVDVFDGPRLLMSRTPNGTALIYYLWGNGLIAQISTNGAPLYALADGQGNVLALTGAGGQLTDQWFYSPYGAVLNRSGSTDIPFQWLGGYGVRSEGGGLYRTRYRVYHAGLMRFTAKDPLGLAGGGNLFAYCNGNPLALVDPWGFCAVYSWWSDSEVWQSAGSGALQGAGTYAEGLVIGAAGAGVVAGGAVVAVTVGVPATVVTGGLLLVGGIGAVTTAGSVINDPSAENISYSIGAITGAGIVGGVSGRSVAARLSPPGCQPSPEPATLSGDVSMRWIDPANPSSLSAGVLNYLANPSAANSTGPSTVGAASTITGAGAGVAGAASLLNAH